MALLKHRKAARRMILECEADDMIRKQPLTLAENMRVTYEKKAQIPSNGNRNCRKECTWPLA